jgi:hypothetical protein
MRYLVLLLTLGFLEACAYVGPPGFIYKGVRTPGQFHPGASTNPGGSEITGEACTMGILGLISIGDSSLDSALRNAGAEGKTLKNVTVDHREMSILFLIYQNFCTRVTAQVVM